MIKLKKIDSSNPSVQANLLPAADGATVFLKDKGLSTPELYAAKNVSGTYTEISLEGGGSGGGTFYGTGVLAGNVYNVTMTSPAISSYTTGQTYVVKVDAANPTPTFLNINSIGIRPVLDAAGNPLEPATFDANGIYFFVYDGTNFQSIERPGIGSFFGSGTLVGNDYLTSMPSPTITGYEIGRSYLVEVDSANPAGANININSLGAIPIVLPDGNPPKAGQLSAGRIYDFVYTGTRFQLLTLLDNDLYYATAGLSGNVFQATMTNPDVDTYTIGQSYYIKLGSASPNPVFLDINSIGVTPVVNNTGATPVAGTLNAGGIYEFIYTGTDFQIISGANISIPEYTYYGTAALSGITYNATMTSPTITSYVVGQVYRINVSNYNTSPVMLDINGLGGFSIKTPAGLNPNANDLQPGTVYEFVFTGSVFQLMGFSQQLIEAGTLNYQVPYWDNAATKWKAQSGVRINPGTSFSIFFAGGFGGINFTADSTGLSFTKNDTSSNTADFSSTIGLGRLSNSGTGYNVGYIYTGSSAQLYTNISSAQSKVYVALDEAYCQAGDDVFNTMTRVGTQSGYGYVGKVTGGTYNVSFIGFNGSGTLNLSGLATATHPAAIASTNMVLDATYPRTAVIAADAVTPTQNNTLYTTNLDTKGSHQLAVRNFSANTAAALGDHVLVFTGGVGVTLTLPGTLADGTEIIVKNLSATDTFTVSGTVDGSPASISTLPFDTQTYIWNQTSATWIGV